MAAPCQPCDAGLSRCHLRRISSRAPVSDVADVIHFWKTVTLIGRNKNVVDYFLGCATPRGNDYISRIHARVIRTSTYDLVDSSLTGVYINDVRIGGRTPLQEGDTVTFGHPAWQSVTLGAQARQPNSPFYFLFEHCHCSLNQMQHLPGGKFPELAAAEASPEVIVRVGLEKKAALSQGASVVPGFLPPHPPPSDRDVHRGGCPPAAFSTPTVPIPLAASARPPVPPSPSTDSSLSLLELPGDSWMGPWPDSALKGSTRSTSQARRSLSPEYAALEEGLPGSLEPPSQGALGTKCGSLIQKSPALRSSGPRGGSEGLLVDGPPGSNWLSPRESCGSEAGRCPLHTLGSGHSCPPLPAPACLEDSAAAALSTGQCGSGGSPAEPPASSSQAEQGEGPEAGLSPPGFPKEPVPAGSGHSQEVMEMETDGSTEGTAASNLTCLPAPSAQDPGVVGEAGKSGGQGASAGPPGDPGLGEEGAPEGHGEILAEKPFSEAGLQEAEQAAVGGVGGNSPSKTAGTPVPEDPAVLPGGSGRRTPPGGPLCGQEPGQEEAMEISPEAAVPWETHGGRDASQDRAPENEVDTERLPHRDTGQLVTGCPLSPRDPEEKTGIADDASLSQLSFAKVEREVGPGMTEAREERTTAVLQHYGRGINTRVAKETLLQEFSVASASDSPAHEVNPEGECSGEGEGAVAAVVACGERQENSPSEDLLETCKEAPPWAAAAPPAGLILGEGMEAGLREQPKDLEEVCTEEGLSQRREACPAGGQEGVAAEGGLGHGSTRWTELGPAAEGQRGHEEGRPEGEGVATSPASAGLAPSPGGEEPDSACGRERKGQEEVGCGGASGGEEWEAQRRGSLTAGEGRLEDLPERLLGQAPGAPQESCSNTGGALARSLGGGIVGGHAGLLPPFQLSSNTLGGGGGGGTPPLEDLCAGRNGKEAGGRGGSGKSRLLPEQGDLSREVHAGPQSSSVGTQQQHPQMAEPEWEGERWADCPVGCGAPSGLAAQAGCLEDAPLGQAPREPELPGAELQGLGKSPEVEPRGADVGQEPFSPAGLPAEGGAWEEGCPADGAMESSASPGPEGSGAAVVAPEQGSPLQQSPGGSSCRGGKGQVSLSLSAAGSEQPRSLLENTPPCPTRQSQAGPSRGFPECPSSDELSLRISDSEAEREESEDSRAPGPSGRGLLLLPKKEAFIPDSVKHLGGVTEDSAVCGRGAEWGATQGQGEAACQEPGGGPLRATDAVAQQSPSCCEPCSDLSQAAAAAPETSVADVAPGGKSPPLGAAVREGPEAPAAEGTALLPLSPPPASDEDEPHLLESDAKLDIEDQAPSGASGAAEEVGSDLREDAGRVGRGSASQPGGGSPEAGEASEGRLQREIPAGACAEREECAQKTKGEALFCLQQGLGTWRPQEDRSQPEGGPGGSKGSVSPGRGRTPFPKEEEPDGCSSRKRQSSKGQEALGVGDSEEDPCSQKRLRLLGSGPDLHSPTRLLSAPLDLERHRDQFSRTIGKFLQQHSSQTALPSAEAEEKNRDSIAQIVRTYFNGTFGPGGGPEAGNLDVEMAVLPLEAGMSEGVDCNPAAGSEAEGSASDEEAESSLPLNAGTRVSPVKSQDLSFCSECSSPSSPSHSSGSQTQQWGQELAAHAPESAWEAYVSEEEEFQSSISSALEHSLLNSSLASPEAWCGQEPCEKSVDLVFSDASNSSAESEHSEPPPDPMLRSSRGVGSGQLPGVLSEAEEVDLASGGAFRSPEPAGMDWRKEETSTLPGRHVSSHERPLTPEADVPVAPGDHLGAVGEKAAAPVLRQAGGPFDGEGDQEAPSKKASERVTSCVSSLVGEAREELDDGPDEMQIEGGPFLQGRHKDAPSQGLERQPAVQQPSDVTLWVGRPACVKVEPAPRHGRELPGEGGEASPSGTAPDVDPWGEDPVRQGSPLCSPRMTPPQSCSPARSSSWPDRCAKRGGADGGSPLPPAGLAAAPEEKGCGEGLERRLLGRSGAGQPGQTDSSSATQGDVGDMRQGAEPLLTAGAGGHPMPACSSLVQEEAPVWLQCPKLSSGSCLVKEEPDPECDSHLGVGSFIPCGAYPTTSSPVIPVLQTPGTAEASEDWVPESPVGRHKEERLLGEAEAPGQLLNAAWVQPGNGHAPCVEAEEGLSSASTASPGMPEPPPQQPPWAGCVPQAGPSSGAGAEGGAGRPWASSEQEVAFQLQECQEVLEEVSRSLRAVEGIDDLHLEKWREQLAELQKATKMPRTYIAVVGNTGDGKSSLLNALLEEEAVLPTSAMRACTAVVVEISRAAGGRPYQAEVEFLSEEEWDKELRALLADMKDKSGKLKKRCPDHKAEARAAYSRVKAVYGTVDEVAALKSIQDVTQHLGTVKRISAETAADFRVKIEKFIDSRTDVLRDMKGGEFWPIVKCVKIHVAQAEVLKTGVVLVDLPGIRDSNAARDSAAREYLKNCQAVWVVASITRAVDDKTAKEVLNSNLRRQLFMDGHYGNLAFICTKTDSFNISDIVRDLDLRGEIQPLEAELEELEGRRLQAEEEKGALHLALHLEPREGVGAAEPGWLQRHHHFLEMEFQLSALQKQKEAKLRAIGLLCVQARNRFSKQQIRMDFNTGLEEFKRKAEFSEWDDDGEEDMEDGGVASSEPDDLGEAEPQGEKLHVFTVSSTEYLKLSGKLLRDGPPQVFHDPKDTEIPDLKNFVIETGLKTSMKATEKVVRDVARVISQIVHYLNNQRAEDASHQAQAQETIQRALQGIPRLLQEAADDVLPDIQYFFGVLIQTSLSRGSNKAKELCEEIVKSWGSPASGFPHSTYHAACLRRGVYTSLKYGCMDFNEQLAKPVNEAIAVPWNGVFGSKVEESLERFTRAILEKLKLFFRELKRRVEDQSSLLEALEALRLQQMEAVQARLCSFLLEQGDSIRRRQRTISRLLTPAVQASMEPAYTACSQMSGPGYFQRMKEAMESYVRNNKDFIFDGAAKKLQEQLQLLQQGIQGSSRSLVLELNKSLQMQFEPLLKPAQRNAEIIPELMNICAKVDKICKRSCVEYVLPSPTEAEASALDTDREPQGNPLCLSARCVDLRLRAVPLPHVAAVQLPSDTEQLLEVPAAASAPPRLPQVVSVVQQPRLPPVNLLPYGRKRAGEGAGAALLEKRHKSQAGPDRAQHPLPRSSGGPSWRGVVGEVVPSRLQGEQGQALEDSASGEW